MPAGSLQEELPSRDTLQSRTADVREVFLNIRNWVKARQHEPQTLSAEARKLDAEHRKCLFDFLTVLPERKPIFHAQAREILQLLADRPEWRTGGVLDDAVLAAALAAPRRKAVPSSGPSGGPDGSGGGGLPFAANGQASVGQAAGAPATSPPATPDFGGASPMVDLETDVDDEPPEVQPLAGFPPYEAFGERSKHDAGDTFKDLRRWTRQLAVWDLAEAGRLLSPAVRCEVFHFLTRICQRKLYSAIGRETLSMLLSVEEWVQGDGVVDSDLEAAISRVMEQRPALREPLTPPEAATVPRPARPSDGYPASPARPPGGGKPRAEPAPGAAQLPAPPRPPPPPAGRGGPDGAGAAAAAAPGGMRARVEAALRSNCVAISDGQELVRLYRDSGLGGEAALNGKATDAKLLQALLVLATQRMRDFYVDDLRRVPGGRSVHFPHLHIDLQRRSSSCMPEGTQARIEGKIRRQERWTSEEKACVLSAKHELTIRYVLAYSLARAKATGRGGAIWIPLGMTTGSTGHANGLCLLGGTGGEAAKALVYDPNFAPNQEHWVHAQKAISDALPKVRKLLDGTGVAVPEQAELFGNGLQTSLGTVAQHKAWFSSTVYTTRRGYPICGSVVHLVATMWCSTGARSPVEVEAALAEIVASGPEGKALVQRRIAGSLKGFDARLARDGEEPFAKGLTRRLDGDRTQWPKEAFKGGGSLTASDGKGRSCTYAW